MEVGGVGGAGRVWLAAEMPRAEEEESGVAGSVGGKEDRGIITVRAVIRGFKW